MPYILKDPAPVVDWAGVKWESLSLLTNLGILVLENPWPQKEHFCSPVPYYSPIFKLVQNT